MNTEKTSPQAVAPWGSGLALLYPLAAGLYAFRAQHSASNALTMALGYALSNLGYAMLAAGLFAGSFRIFGLVGRGRVLVVAVLAWIAGTVLSNLN